MARTSATWSREQAALHGARGRATAAANRERARTMRQSAAVALRDPDKDTLTHVASLIATCLRLLPSQLGTLRGERLARTLAALLDTQPGRRARREDTSPALTAPSALPDSPDAPV